MSVLLEEAQQKVDARRVFADAKKPPTPGREPTVRFVRGDAVKLEPIHWLWPGYLPAGMLTILGGAPGCGKTTIALSLAAAVTNGGKWPDGLACHKQGDVLIWSGEDAWPVIAARLAAAGADMRRVHFVDGLNGLEGDQAFDPARDMDLLESAARKLEAPRLLILDPIVSVAANDSHKNAETRRSLQPIVALAARLGCAVFGITHFTKGTAGRDPVERITGSLAFAAVARVVLVAAKSRGDAGDAQEAPRLFLRAKSNIGPDEGGFAYQLERVDVAPQVEGQRVAWGERLDGNARELLGDAETDLAETGGSGSATSDATEFLRDLLGTEGMLSREATRRMRAEGFSEKVIRTARERLEVRVKRDGFGQDMKSYWSLPFMPSNASHAHKCPPKREGSNGQECRSEGTNDAQADDMETF